MSAMQTSRYQNNGLQSLGTDSAPETAIIWRKAQLWGARCWMDAVDKSERSSCRFDIWKEETGALSGYQCIHDLYIYTCKLAYLPYCMLLFRDLSRRHAAVYVLILHESRFYCLPGLLSDHPIIIIMGLPSSLLWLPKVSRERTVTAVPTRQMR